MKKYFGILLIAALFVASAASANDKTTPKVNPIILKSFQNDFRYSSAVTWTLIGETYVARFTQLDVAYEAYYASNGTLLGFLYPGKPDVLSPAAQNKLDRKFPAGEVLSVSRLYTVGSGVSFLATIKQGSESRIVHIQRDGTIESIHKSK